MFKMNFEDVTLLYNEMKKENEVSKKCDLSKIKKKGDQELYYIYINRKQISSKTREGLIEKLYDIFYPKVQMTLEDAYKCWFLEIQKVANCTKTLREYHNEWKSYVLKDDISQMNVSTITPKEMKKYYFRITRGYAITRKRLANVNVVLNGVLDRLVEEDIIEHNPIDDINMKEIRKRCRASKSNKKNYTTDERQRLLDYLDTVDDDMYAVAIQFDFFMTVRIGELLSLKFSDINGDHIKIEKSLREEYDIDENFNFKLRDISSEDRIKGNLETGYRDIFLVPRAKEIIEKARKLNPDGEFIFMQHGRLLNYKTYGTRLKKYCNDIGISYNPSHQIRFTSATALYQSGIDITQISTLLGHSDTATTWHYIRKNKPTERTEEKMLELWS